jgi:hypothetical protein
VLKQISSTGYLRKRVPQELVVLQGGAGAVAGGSRRGAMELSTAGGGTIAAAVATTAVTTGSVSMDAAHQGADAGLRRRGLRRVRKLHAGAQWHLHEVQHLRGDERM